MFFRQPKFPVYPQSNHYNPDSKQFYNTPPTQALKKGAAGELWKMAADDAAYRPNTRLPMEQPDWRDFFSPSEHAKLIWFGHSTLLVRIDGKTVLIDPVYYRYAAPVPIMMRRFQEPPVALHELPPIDWIVYSHAHYDHLDADVVAYFAKHSPQTRFMVPLGLGEYLRQWGIAAEQIQELDWFQAADDGRLRFHAVPARHDAARTPFDKRRSLWAGWVLESGKEKIYFSGDSAYAPHFQEIGRHFGGFDLAFVENGQYNELWPDNHMFPEQTVQAALDVKAKRWMPIHWGAYPLSTHAWDDSVRQSSRLSDKLELNMLTPVMGQVFDRNTPTQRWWEQLEPSAQ